ncbi:hypothetical protein N7528_001123 [Penicillium herquei]|nr:hypothetical protein N7528_001123 [Penicillium herquei]
MSFQGSPEKPLKGSSLETIGNSLETIDHPEHRKVFAVAARYLLDPSSELSQQHPTLHQTLQSRLETAFAYRNNEPISRCEHTVFDGVEFGRTDGMIYQYENNSAQVDFYDPPWEDNAVNRVDEICNTLSLRLEVYGILGTGTFGAVYLARERHNGFSDINKLKHFAIKIERHETIAANIEGWDPVPFYDNGNAVRYIPDEALYLLFLSHSDRFPKLDSVYLHDRFQSIVMAPSVDPSLDRRLRYADTARRFPAFIGRYLMNIDHTPLLDEMQACKVASQLLQGIVEMAQIHLVHLDLSITNFIVDAHLNVQLIDLGHVGFGLENTDFIANVYGYLPFQEYQTSPEMACILLRPENQERDWEGRPQLTLKLRTDVRKTMIWKFGVLVYGILHGYWPWFDPRLQQNDLLYFDGQPDDEVNCRRTRILYEDLPIREDLSQDCKDVLTHLFQKDPNDRPSLETLVCYPWFSQWAYQNRVYERPFSQRFQNSFSAARVPGQP